MGDWIRDNMFTANIIATLVLIAVFSFSLGKPYVDRMDAKSNENIDNVRDTIATQLDIIIEGNDSINANLKRIAHGR